MQLETGKSKHGLVGSFKNIIAEEGCVKLCITRPKHAHETIGLGDYTGVRRTMVPCLLALYWS